MNRIERTKFRTEHKSHNNQFRRRTTTPCTKFNTHTHKEREREKERITCRKGIPSTVGFCREFFVWRFVSCLFAIVLVVSSFLHHNIPIEWNERWIGAQQTTKNIDRTIHNKAFVVLHPILIPSVTSITASHETKQNKTKRNETKRNNDDKQNGRSHRRY